MGVPVYCTDNLQSIDYDIIKSLCMANGLVPELKTYAKLTADCIFKRPQDGFIKYYNVGENSLVLGVFNCVNNSAEEVVSLDFLPDDKTYAVYSHANGFIGWLNRSEGFKLRLNGISADVISFIPECNGVAVIGDETKLLSAEFVKTTSFDGGINLTSFENCVALIAVKKEGVAIEGNSLPCGITRVELTKDNIIKMEIL